MYRKVKDYSKRMNRVITYFEIGKLLYEVRQHYGDNIIEKYSEKLMIEVGKIYNKKILFKIRQLSWSHCLILIPIKNIDEINYYINRVCYENLRKFLELIQFI